MSDPTRPETDLHRPYLEHFPKQGEPPHRIVLQPLPFCIGRSKTANWIVYSTKVSKEHAAISQEGERFLIQDLGSTNGTFVNGRRIKRWPLSNGDIVHVAHEEFRFGDDGPGANGPLAMTDPVSSRLPCSRIQAIEHLGELLDQKQVTAVFQPIVDLEGHRHLAYEALGRGTHQALSRSPLELFRLAEECQLAADLSRAFRAQAMEQARYLPDNIALFVNLHPSEMNDHRLLDQLQQGSASLRPGQCLVVEVHESAMIDPGQMRQLRDGLKQLDMGLAFDDFGAGQSRLLDLAEVPPDYVKLDRSLVRNIEQDASRQQIVGALSNVIRERGAKLIAEGIETASELSVCRRLGCQLGQGYLFARPAPPQTFAE